ncbi:MAG: hypothetical protein J7L53_07460 [Deltaproteobacteria bacterium]|nr:hypothetical protein [Deltaproteobacteria bacterium]
MIEKIPFLHRDVVYNIIIADDLTFDALHYILDCLLEQRAFDDWGDSADLRTIRYKQMLYTVYVDSLDVTIHTKIL